MKCIEDEIPFEVPEGWAWCRLGDIISLATDYVANGSFKTLRENVTTYREQNYALFIRTVDFSNDFKKDLSYIDKKSYEFLSKSQLHGGELMLSNIGASIGKIFRIPYFEMPMSLAPNSIVVKFYTAETYDFFEYVFKSFVGQGFLLKLTAGTAMPKFSKTELKRMVVPLAPLAEQVRIATRCRELLNLVDRIENEKEIINAIISQTKSKILDLAIRGKLVPQAPEDEPASKLLERIREEKEELIKQGKIKRDKKESIIFKGEDNSYYQRTGNLLECIADWNLDDIPDNWVLCCLGEVCDYGHCISIDSKELSDNAWVLDLEDIEKDSGKIIKKVRKAVRDSSSTKHQFRKGQVLYSKLRPYLNKVVLADEDGFCTSEILPLDFSTVIEPKYALYYFMSPTFLKYANHCSYGVKMPRLGTIDGKRAVFPIPPFEEQQRIALQISKIFSYIDTISNSLL